MGIQRIQRGYRGYHADTEETMGIQRIRWEYRGYNGGYVGCNGNTKDIMDYRGYDRNTKEMKRIQGKPGSAFSS